MKAFVLYRVKNNGSLEPIGCYCDKIAAMCAGSDGTKLFWTNPEKDVWVGSTINSQIVVIIMLKELTIVK